MIAAITAGAMLILVTATICMMLLVMVFGGEDDE